MRYGFNPFTGRFAMVPSGTVDPILAIPGLLHYSGTWYPQLYLNASAEPVMDGEAVATVLSANGSGDNFTQGVGILRPLWDVDGGPNGDPSLETDEGGQFLEIDLSALTEGEAFFVCRNIPGQGSYGLYQFGGVHGALLPYDVNVIPSLWDSFGTSDQQGPVSPSVLTDYDPYAWTCHNPSIDAEGNWEARLNGEVWHSASGLTVAFPASCFIGRSSLVTTHTRYDATIIFGRKLSAGERSIVQEEIASRTGISFNV